jgi:putative DNA primase/helicase
MIDDTAPIGFDAAAKAEATAEADRARVQSLLNAGIDWELRNDKNKPIPGVANCAKFLEGILDAKRLRFNEYTGEIEQGGKRVVTEWKVDEWRAQIEKTSGVGKWTESDFNAALRLLIAKVKRYHPIREYLEGCAEKWDGTERIGGMVGNQIPLRCEVLPHHHRYFEVFLFGAVCRIMRPGCKYDTALVLAGEEGVRKSSLFQWLVPDQAWFLGNMPPLGDKDALMAIQTAWIVEWAELDNMRKAEVTAIKSFLTNQDDSYRAPYGKKMEKHPRKCVFAGTTNEFEFLISKTGNRRFMVLPVAKKPAQIDTDWIGENRDQIWGEALTKCRMHKYDGIKLLKLDESTEASQREDNLQYSPANEWEAPVLKWLTNEKVESLGDKRYISTDSILSGLEIPIERRAQAQKEVGSVLRANGWEAGRHRVYPGANPSRVFWAPTGWSCSHWDRIQQEAAL